MTILVKETACSLQPRPNAVHTPAFESICETFVRTHNEPLLAGRASPAPSALEMVDCYTIEATGQPLDIYKTASLSAGTWLQIDDIEMSVDESLSQDEVAQCIFAICGGDLQQENAVGETSKHWVYYSTELRGLLGLSPKPAAAS